MKVILSPNPYRDLGLRAAQAAKKILERSGVEAVISLPFELDEHSRVEIPSHLKLRPLGEVLPGADILICFGGDGTILHAARLVGNRDIPLLGINTGTMGFMAELETNELELLNRLVEDQYTVDPRMTLHVSVRRNGRVLYEDNALNDAVITKGAVARVIQMAIYCDGQEAMNFDGDGVTICTPTGSTAYSLSAGGPIVEPEAKNIIVTPICGHTMFSHSLVLSKERTVSAKIGRIGKRNAFLSVDGGKAFRLNSEDEVIVTASSRTIKLLHVKNNSFYGLLSQKFQG